MKTTTAKLAALMFGATLMIATAAYADSKCGGDKEEKKERYMEKKASGKCGGDQQKRIERYKENKASGKCGGDKEERMEKYMDEKRGSGKCGS